jgi:hypothetical protein
VMAGVEHPKRKRFIITCRPGIGGGGGPPCGLEIKLHLPFLASAVEEGLPIV